jgi:hypothetical protein
MSSRCLTVGALALLWCAVIPASASADSIQLITSGSIVADLGANPDSATFTLAGDSFNLSGRSMDGAAWAGCNPCLAGTTTTAQVAMGDGNVSGTVNGSSFENLRLGGLLLIFQPLMLPVDATTPMTVTFPFAVDSSRSILRGMAGPRGPDETVVFSLPLAGTGIATLTLQTDPFRSDTFNPAALRFDFGPSSPAPTPEPGTVILFGAGLAAILARRRTPR